MDRDNKLVAQIQKSHQLKQRVATICLFVTILGLLSFLFFSFYGVNRNIKFVSSNKEKIKSAEKIMTNPNIKYEHKSGQIFDITAKRAIHKNQDNVELFDVVAIGDSGKITAGNLIITNNGNNLHFSNNPILIINEKNEQ